MRQDSVDIAGRRKGAVLAVIRAAGRFRRDENGGIMPFALVILVLMLFIGGMAVDLMRFEAERARIQATADAAVLAAASMRQVRDPQDVVEDWFDKAGLRHALQGVIVDDGLNYRSVRADVRTTTQPFFMHMMGVNELAANSAGRAIEARTNVEIAMVLDISGSMQNQPSRITNLKEAATEFVQEILDDDDENRVSISLVPYNGQVVLGPGLFLRFSTTNNHSHPGASGSFGHANYVDNGRCIDIPTSAYNQLALSQSTTMRQSSFIDSFSGALPVYSGTTTEVAVNNYYAPGAPYRLNNVYVNVMCNPLAANHVRVHSNNSAQLVQQINNLHAIGATSIDIGLRWGAALLDPSARDIVSDLSGAGQVPSHFIGRPFDYDDEEVLKVIVLMTDGEHFEYEETRADYRDGQSPIFLGTDGRYSIYHASRSGNNKYYTPHDNSWRSSAWSSGTRLNWDQVWLRLRAKWVAYQLYARPLASNSDAARMTYYLNQLELFRSKTPTSEMDARLLNLCSQVKGQNVVIFGIAFEAPVNAANLIRNCASDEQFYDVAGLDIQTAFRHIRAQISALRLTQ